MLVITGSAMSGVAAVEFLEMLPDNIPDEIKDDEFCDEYERMLNRVRHEVIKSFPVAPKVTESTSRRNSNFYNCGQCGFGLRADIYDYCPKCSRKISWKSVLPERLE